MENYSLNFLMNDWDGAGYDFSFACVFNQEQIDKQSVVAFAQSVIHVSRTVKMKYIADETTTQWKFIPIDDTADFLCDTWCWESIQLLVLDVTTRQGFNGYVEMNQPDHIIVGGPSEAFYSGNSSQDQAISQDIIELVKLGCDAFGEGYGCFGVSGDAVRKAIQMRQRNEPNNLTQNMDSIGLAKRITEMCMELRRHREVK